MTKSGISPRFFWMRAQAAGGGAATANRILQNGRGQLPLRS